MGEVMRCYYVVENATHRIVDIGTMSTCSEHGSTKLAHVYHPVRNCDTPAFCLWDMSNYSAYCVEGLSYSEVLKGFRIDQDTGNHKKYLRGVKAARLTIEDIVSFKSEKLKDRY